MFFITLPSLFLIISFCSNCLQFLDEFSLLLFLLIVVVPPVNEIKFALIFAVEKVFSFEKRTPKITRISAAALPECVWESVYWCACVCVCVARDSASVFVSIKSLHFLGVNRAGIKVVALAAWWASAIRYDMLRCDAMCIYLLKNRGESSESRAAMPCRTFLPCVSNGQRRWWCPSRTTTTTRDDADADDDDDDVVKYFWVQGGVRSLRKLVLLPKETWQRN